MDIKFLSVLPSAFCDPTENQMQWIVVNKQTNQVLLSSSGVDFIRTKAFNLQIFAIELCGKIYKFPCYFRSTTFFISVDSENILHFKEEFSKVCRRSIFAPYRKRKIMYEPSKTL